MSRRPPTRSLLLAFCAIFAVPVSIVWAQQKPVVKPDATRGAAIAERLCVSCHLTSNQSPDAAAAGIPTFAAMANKPNQTAERVRAMLMMPHAPMPNMSMSRLEIEDVISYLDTLRKPSAGPPIGDDKTFAPKPVYPKKS